MGYEGTQEDFIEAFLQDQVIYAPFNEHILDFWSLRHEPNILFLFYEDMKSNTDKVVKQTAKFLGKSFTQQQIDKLCEHLSVDKMRANPACNNDSLVEMAKSVNGNGKASGDFKFIRRGEVGSYKDDFTIELHKKFENFTQQSSLDQHQFSHRI